MKLKRLLFKIKEKIRCNSSSEIVGPWRFRKFFFFFLHLRVFFSYFELNINNEFNKFDNNIGLIILAVFFILHGVSNTVLALAS